MLTPIDLTGRGLVRAHLEIIDPKAPEISIIPLRFNPTEYQLQKSNNFAEIGIPGLESPPIQFVRGASEKLTAELLVDTSDTLEDVRTRYVDNLRQLMRVNGDRHAPPVVRFVWDSQVFVGVMESLNITYVLFSPEGVPLRAKLSVSLKEYRPVAIQLNDPPRHSPDYVKTYLTRNGDTLSSISAQYYQDPASWREIARANGVKDPRRIQPGRKFTLPKLR